MSTILEQLKSITPAERAFLLSELQGRKASSPSGKKIGFGLLFFSSDGTESKDGKYDLLFDAARFADEHDFVAIWTPERHFQPFGGLYPNPVVLAAALAMVTRRIQLRSGSVVLPLHNPVRVAEEWAVVDNLSRGRVALSMANGWHKDDFAIRPEAFHPRREILDESLERFQQLWAGEAVMVPGVDGVPRSIRTYPRPIQPKLELWLTGASETTWRKAGGLGANVLCLMGPSIDDLRDKIGIYRHARREAGHDPDAGKITVTLHTYIAETERAARERVREPLKNYLEDYIQQFRALMPAEEVAQLEGSKNAILDFAFERYFQTSSLLGNADKCIRMVNALGDIGVNEIASLIDFGLPHQDVMDSLKRLAQLRRLYA